MKINTMDTEICTHTHPYARTHASAQTHTYTHARTHTLSLIIKHYLILKKIDFIVIVLGDKMIIHHIKEFINHRVNNEFLPANVIVIIT